MRAKQILQHESHQVLLDIENDYPFQKEFQKGISIQIYHLGNFYKEHGHTNNDYKVAFIKTYTKTPEEGLMF